MWSVEILVYCYKAICVAFLWELNNYVFLNWGLFLLLPLLLNHRGCAFFVCVMKKRLIWKLLHKPHSILGRHGNSISSFSSNWTNRLRKSSTSLTLVIELLYNTLSKEYSEQQQLNYVLMFQKGGSLQAEKEETKWCKMMDTYQEGKKADISLGLELGHPTKD